MPALFLIYIAIVIAFFLLGWIIGYIANPRRKLKKQKEKPLTEVAKVENEKPQTLKQNAPADNSDLMKSQYPDNQRYGYSNNYNNFGNYYGNDGYSRKQPPLR